MHRVVVSGRRGTSYGNQHVNDIVNAKGVGRDLYTGVFGFRESENAQCYCYITVEQRFLSLAFFVTTFRVVVRNYNRVWSFRTCRPETVWYLVVTLKTAFFSGLKSFSDLRHENRPCRTSRVKTVKYYIVCTKFHQMNFRSSSVVTLKANEFDIFTNYQQYSNMSFEKSHNFQARLTTLKISTFKDFIQYNLYFLTIWLGEFNFTSVHCTNYYKRQELNKISR